MSSKESGKDCECYQGPGYASPKDAYLNGPREKYLFVLCPNANKSRPDMIASVDVDPKSSTYCQVISRVDLPYAGDEVHHSGWNTCSSCYGDCDKKRCYLIVPCLNSSRIYIIDTENPCNLRIHKIVAPEDLYSVDCSFPHTTHCAPNGTVMISTLGCADETNKGDFILLDGKTFDLIGTWPSSDSEKAPFNYDFWYQPRHNLMISTEWGSPIKIKKGFSLEHIKQGFYGKSLNIWNWKERKLIQKIDLEEPYGWLPFEIRFLHDPSSIHGYFITAFGSSLYHFYKAQDQEGVLVEKVDGIEPKRVHGWILPEMPALFADTVISMDDKYLYVSVWLHGELLQYDISDRFHPKLVGKLDIGGLLHKKSDVTPIYDSEAEMEKRPDGTYVQGKRIDGGAQMLQLSLDGKRLYVNMSLYRIWDFQMQPRIKNGTRMILVDVDMENGGMKINEDFLVDFSSLPGGPYLAHEMRYPGGDCTSDIWI